MKEQDWSLSPKAIRPFRHPRVAERESISSAERRRTRFDFLDLTPNAIGLSCGDHFYQHHYNYLYKLAHVRSIEVTDVGHVSVTMHRSIA